VCGVILEQLERRVELWVKDKNKKSANCHEKILRSKDFVDGFYLASLPNGTTIFNPHAVFLASTVCVEHAITSGSVWYGTQSQSRDEPMCIQQAVTPHAARINKPPPTEYTHNTRKSPKVISLLPFWFETVL
jgi:hypothetical protein